ncbi:hypothetical protein IC575_023239 [Cucumis melo]
MKQRGRRGGGSVLRMKYCGRKNPYRRDEGSGGRFDDISAEIPGTHKTTVGDCGCKMGIELFDCRHRSSAGGRPRSGSRQPRRGLGGRE